MSDLWRDLRKLGESIGFSGVVAISSAHERVFELATGYSDRENRRLNTVETRFATASATKGFTALAVCAMIDSGEFALDTKLLSLLGDDLSSVDASVTIEQLLSHTSGVGDYVDEEQIGDIDDFVLSTPVENLRTVHDYLHLLTPQAQKTPPGALFAYNNSGYVMLSLAVEAVSKLSFYALVDERVTKPAGMLETAFLASDDLPLDAALGYLKDGRSNNSNLPLRGAGDGGIYSTVGDIDKLWSAIFAGTIVPPAVVESMLEPRNTVASEGLSYGLGFWLCPESSSVILQGMDAGVSFWSSYNLATRTSYTVMSNSSTGAWPIQRLLAEQMGF